MNLSLIERITDYLVSGGLFNPELAEHDKVRDLLIDCRQELEDLKADALTITTQSTLDYARKRRQNELATK